MSGITCTNRAYFTPSHTANRPSRHETPCDKTTACTTAGGLFGFGVPMTLNAVQAFMPELAPIIGCTPAIAAGSAAGSAFVCAMVSIVLCRVTEGCCSSSGVAPTESTSGQGEASGSLGYGAINDDSSEYGPLSTYEEQPQPQSDMNRNSDE